MQVTMKTEVSGTRDGKPWPKRGGVVDLPNDEAVALIAAKHAEPVKPEEPETASAPTAPVETATAPAPAAVETATPARRGRPPKTA